MIRKSTFNQLIESHSWTAILECLPQSDAVALKVPDPNALESFRAYVYQQNAYRKIYRMSVRRKDLEISIAKC